MRPANSQKGNKMGKPQKMNKKEAGKLGWIAGIKYREENKKRIRDQYYSNPKLCKNCNKTDIIKKHLIHSRIKHNQVICTKCNPIGQSCRSSHEINMSKFLSTLNVNFEETNRKILKRQELDFYFPTLNKAIECNGTYWHSKSVVVQRDKLKENLCKNKNIDLLVIHEDLWYNFNELQRSIIYKFLT